MTCSGYCYTDVLPNSDRCATRKDVFFCINAYNGILIILGTLLIPTFLMFTVSLICRVKVPIITFLSDTGTNICLSLIIFGCACVSKFHNLGICPIIVAAPLYIAIFALRCLNASNDCDKGSIDNETDIMNEEDFKQKQKFVGSKIISTYECLEVLKQLKTPKISKRELMDIIQDNHTAPPTPEVTVIDFEFDPIDNLKLKKNILQQSTYPIDYASWQEDSKALKINPTTVISYKCDFKYEYDETMFPQIDTYKARALSEIPSDHPNRKALVFTNTHNMVHRAVAVTKESCCVSICSSCFVTKFFYYFLMVFGYTSIIDFIWLLKTTQIEDSSIKKISFASNFRAKKGEREAVPENPFQTLSTEDTLQTELL